MSSPKQKVDGALERRQRAAAEVQASRPKTQHLTPGSRNRKKGFSVKGPK